MLQKFLSLIDQIHPFPTASAHCDIPCGMYDPNDSIEPAKSMRKMIQKMHALPPDDVNNRTRMIMAKEEFGKKCKHELSTLWSDYFKPEHLEKVPDLHEKVWLTLKQVSKVKQSTDEAEADKLLDMLDEIAAMFEKVEGSPKKE